MKTYIESTATQTHIESQKQRGYHILRRASERNRKLGNARQKLALPRHELHPLVLAVHLVFKAPVKKIATKKNGLIKSMYKK